MLYICSGYQLLSTSFTGEGGGAGYADGSNIEIALGKQRAGYKYTKILKYHGWFDKTIISMEVLGCILQNMAP